TVVRLKEAWTEEHARWQKRDLSAKRYVYCWADGIHLEARLEDQAQCILVIIGATPEGKKELIGFTDGLRESSQSRRDLLLDLKRRGLTTAPQIAVADGALGFWKALGEVWPTIHEQRCWVHKTANILNKMPKGLRNKAARAMVFKLIEGAQKRRRRIDGHNQLPNLIRGVKFTDGIEVFGASAVPQAAA